MQKKPVLITTITLIISAILISFSNNKTTEIILISNSDNLEQYVDHFNRLQQDFRVRLQVIGDYESTMKVRFNSDHFGDIFIVPRSISKSTYVDILEPLGYGEEFEEIYPLTGTNTIDDVVYAIPISFSISGGIFYDNKVLNNHGIKSAPRTPEELYYTLKKLGNNKKITPIVSNYHQKWLLNNWYDLILGSPDNLDSTLLLEINPFDNNSIYLKTFELLYNMANKKLIEDDIYTWNFKDTLNLFSQGVLGATSLPLNYYSEIIKHAKHPESICYIPFNNNNDLILNSVYSLGINSNSNHKKESRLFLEYLFNETTYMNEMKQLPHIKEQLKSEGYNLITPPAYRYDDLFNLEHLIWESESGLFTHFKIMEYIDRGFSGHTSFEKMVSKQREMWKKIQLKEF